MSSHDHTFLTEREIIDDIMESLPEGDKKFVREQEKKELINYHHTWGKWIRNSYNMWITENPYVVHADSIHVDFPDQRSQRIIEGVWELLQIVE